MLNNKGFGLIQIIISMGVISIIGAGTATLIGNSYKSISDMTGRIDENIFRSDLNSVFRDKDLCSMAIAGSVKQTIPTSGPLKLKLSIPGYGVVAEGKKLPSGMIIKEFYMDSFTPPVAIGTSGISKVIGSLWVRTEDVSSANLKRKVKNIGLQTLYINSSSKEIMGCFEAASMPPDEICTDIGATWDGKKCVVSAIGILGKQCQGNTLLAGYTTIGEPICRTVDSSQPSVVYVPSTTVSSTTTTPTPTPQPPPKSPQIGVMVQGWSGGGGIVNVNISDAEPGAAVTYTRYVNGAVVSSGPLGSVSSAGTFGISAEASCHHSPPPCSTSYTFCANGVCRSQSTTLPK